MSKNFFDINPSKYNTLLEDKVPAMRVNRLINGETVVITSNYTELFSFELDGKTVRQTAEQLYNSMKFTDEKCFIDFIKDNTTFGGFKFSFQAEGNPVAEEVTFFGKTEKAQNFYRYVLNDLAAASKLSNVLKLGTDWIGCQLKVWAVSEYSVYQNKESGVWQYAKFYNLKLQDPGYDIFEADAKGLAKAKKEVAKNNHQKTTKIKKTTKVATV